VYGDDLDESLEECAERFHVDLSTYRRYFHTGEEGLPPASPSLRRSA